MKRISGTPFLNNRAEFNLNSATPELMETFQAQRTLYEWLCQLRSFSTPHSEMVCGFSEGPWRAIGLKEAKRKIGSFSNVKVFHAQNFCMAYPNYSTEADERTNRLVLERPSKEYRICLAHGDLQPHNILIGDKNWPCGMVDWKSASWMPEYWEHTYHPSSSLSTSGQVMIPFAFKTRTASLNHTQHVKRGSLCVSTVDTIIDMALRSSSTLSTVVPEALRFPAWRLKLAIRTTYG